MWYACLYIYKYVYYMIILCDDEATRWLCIWYTCIYKYKYDHDMSFHLIVMLRSITGPYGWPMIEIAYGEMIFSLHRGCMEDDSSRRVVGVSAWCITHVWHTRVNTSMGSVYIYFLIFNISKSAYMIMFSKSICSIKEHWWSLALSWSDEV